MSSPLDVFKASLSGISLVEASAGTGKTYNITSLYVRAVLEKGLDPSQILVMTYTEAATAELKFRLRNRLKESLEAVETGDPEDDPFLNALIQKDYPDAKSRLQNAVNLFDEAAVFTIHGFCSRILTEFSLQFGVSPDFKLLTDESELLQECVDQYWRVLQDEAENSDQQFILLDYLTDQGFGPDELKDVLLEVIRHSDSKLVPESLSLERLFGLIPELEKAFNQIKGAWEREGNEIDELYHSGNLNGRYFRESATKEQNWENLIKLLNDESPKIGIDEKLSRFGSYMQEKGSSSKFTVPEYDFFQFMDRYISITEELKLLKPAFIQDAVYSVKQQFKTEKELSNLLTYNDLLEVVEIKLRKSSNDKLAAKLSDKYPLALVDEFQDTDPTQYSIFRRIYEGREDAALFMIGDPKQAIYGFRGADIFTYLEAKKDAADSQSYTLSNNFRSNKLMIEGVNELFTRSETPFLFEGLSFNTAHFPDQKTDDQYIKNSKNELLNPLQLISLNNEESGSKGAFSDQLFESICDEVIEFLSGDYTINGRDVAEKDIAILVRRGFEGEEIQARLRAKGLKSVLKSRSSVFQTKEADELFLILKAIQKISYEPGVRAALATELLGFKAQELSDLLDDEIKWSSVIQKLVELKAIWEKRGIESCIEQMLSAFNVQESLALQKDAERRITNLMHLAELLAKEEREAHIQGKALLKWFYQKMNTSGTESDEEQLRLESDENLIQISTIHAAKGLQYPIVLCPFLWDSGASKKKNDLLKFHKDGENLIDISNGITHSQRDEFTNLAEEQEKAEEVRLAYVALTRAVSACYVFLPDYKKINDSALASIITGFKSNKKVDYAFIQNSLNECEYIEVREPSTPKKTSTQTGKADRKIILEAAEFKRKDALKYPRMLSYSSLAEGREHGEVGKDYDEFFTSPEEELIEFNKYGFPKGAGAGTCLHNIFEDIRFNDPTNLEQVISDNLEYYGFELVWRKPLKNWVESTLVHNLGNPALSLSGLKESEVLKEMEFFFPVEGIEAQKLWKLIRVDQPDSPFSQPLSGFMKGYIDLTFRHGDTYYILDYKSNHLGHEPHDYDPSKLTEAVTDAGYDLQYHIYTLALHRFLRSRMKEYDYDQHFGGVLYLFLRGVESDQAGSGVFFDRPDKKLIDAMDQYFSTGREG